MLPFVIYADFECILKETQDESKYQKHVPIGYCVYVVSIDGQWNRDPLVYHGLDCMDKFMEVMDSLNTEIQRVFHKTMPMKKLTPEQQHEFMHASECYCCQEKFSGQERQKVRDHCHITGEYRGAACSPCNLNALNIIAKSHMIPAIFHNLKGYNIHHIMKNLGQHNVNILASSSEKIMTASIEKTHEGNYANQSYVSGGIKYINSLAFLNTSLANLANNLQLNELVKVEKWHKKKLVPGLYQDCSMPDIQYNLAGEAAAGKEFLNPADSQDYRNQPAIQERLLKPEERVLVDRGLQLMKRKRGYPSDWMNHAEKLAETSLPPKEAFYNKLSDSYISDEDYQHAQNVWEFFGCRTFKDYHELYLVTDVLLLADIFETFRKISVASYGLDPCYYISAPAMAWDAMLKMTGITLELLTEEQKDIYLLMEAGIRGGVSTAVHRHAESDENSSIVYLDANNLYGWAMSQPLPYGGFKQNTQEQIARCDVEAMLSRTDMSVGYIFKVDLEYPTELHDLHADLPLAPERLKVQEEWLSVKQREVYQAIYKKKFSTTSKLIPNLLDKKNYILHEKNLALYLRLGL